MTKRDEFKDGTVLTKTMIRLRQELALVRAEEQNAILISQTLSNQLSDLEREIAASRHDEARVSMVVRRCSSEFELLSLEVELDDVLAGENERLETVEELTSEVNALLVQVSAARKDLDKQNSAVRKRGKKNRKLQERVKEITGESENIREQILEKAAKRGKALALMDEARKDLKKCREVQKRKKSGKGECLVSDLGGVLFSTEEQLIPPVIPSQLSV